MAAIQYDGVDATLVFPDPDIEKVIELSLSNGSVLQQNYTVSIPLIGEPSTSQGDSTKEFWG